MFAYHFKICKLLFISSQVLFHDELWMDKKMCAIEIWLILDIKNGCLSKKMRILENTYLTKMSMPFTLEHADTSLKLP